MLRTRQLPCHSPNRHCLNYELEPKHPSLSQGNYKHFLIIDYVTPEGDCLMGFPKDFVRTKVLFSEGRAMLVAGAIPPVSFNHGDRPAPF